MGADPATGSPMVVKDGRFGPYVTDGETNASLRKGDEVSTLTVERAAELLADRRAAAPSPRAKRTTDGQESPCCGEENDRNSEEDDNGGQEARGRQEDDNHRVKAPKLKKSRITIKQS